MCAYDIHKAMADLSRVGSPEGFECICYYLAVRIFEEFYCGRAEGVVHHAIKLDKQVGFVRDVTTDNPLPSSAYDISSVNLSENFSPLVGLNMTMKNSLSAKFEYRKQRNISLNINSVQITEGHTDEFVIGAGYTIKNLNFVTKNRDGGQKKVSNDLKLNVDISYKDIKTLLRKVEEDLTQASSGNKVLGIKISADYVLSQKINLQFFYDHQGTTPLISSSSSRGYCRTASCNALERQRNR